MTRFRFEGLRIEGSALSALQRAPLSWWDIQLWNVRLHVTPRYTVLHLVLGAALRGIGVLRRSDLCTELLEQLP